MEIWKNILGWEGHYQASTLGRIRSLDRVVFVFRNGRKEKRFIKGRIFKITPGNDGYSLMTLRIGKRISNIRLHTLVLLTFVGPCPRGMEARHFPDRNRQNNKLSNLSWGTRKQNCADMKVHGTDNRGERGGMSKLRTIDVVNIRKRLRLGDLQRIIAQDYGVDQSQISKILHNECWEHVQ